MNTSKSPSVATDSYRPEGRARVHARQNALDRSRRSRCLEAVSVALVIGAALAAWEIAVGLNNTPPYLLPAPSLVARTLADNTLRYLNAAVVTLLEALVGLALGLGVGALVAIVITFWRVLERGVLALAILVKATPIVAVTPLLIIWFGFGPVPKIIVIALMTFFPILVNVHVGLRSTDDAILDLFHSLAASRWELFRHAQWPSALPYLCAALRVTGPLSLVGAVVAEWAGASGGLGRTMWLAYTNLDMPALFAAVVCSAVMGIGLYGLVIAFEARVIFWD